MRVEPIASATSSRCASLTLSIWRPLSTTLPAGNDVEMGGGSYSFIQIPRRSSPVAFSRTHTSASQQRRPRSIIHTKESVALARQIDTESIVLHENHNILPLSKTANVAVIGPMEHGYINYGDYVVNGSYLTGVSPYDGIKAASSGSTTFTQGCERWLRPIRFRRRRRCRHRRRCRCRSCRHLVPRPEPALARPQRHYRRARRRLEP